MARRGTGRCPPPSTSALRPLPSNRFGTEEVSHAHLHHRGYSQCSYCRSRRVREDGPDRRDAVCQQDRHPPRHTADGSSFSDFEKEEKEHKHSIYSCILHADHEGKRINLIDTPGSPDLIGSALACLPAVETVAVVINARTASKWSPAA